MKRSVILRKLAVCLAAAAVLTSVAAFGLLNGPDSAASDALYQRGGSPDGEIVVIGMDQRALDAFGPMPWPRDIMAQAIEYLNNADPDNAPAVIGVDVLYVGESGDGAADAYLAETAAMGENVVVASAATFDSRLVKDGDTFYMDDRTVVAWDAPYPDLADVTDSGHINQMMDRDGVLRHALLWIDVPGEGRVASFARVIYERWCEEKGLAPNAAPEIGDGFFYLPLTGRPGAYYEDVSVADLVAGTVDPSYFAGKIVLIGPYALGMQDQYPTAIDHSSPMYGVEYQANAIDAFRSGFLPREANEKAQLAALFVLCALALFLFLDRRVLTSLALWLALAGAWIAACLIAYRAGVILHVLWVPLGLTILFIASVAVNYIRASREKHRIHNTFGHYIDPAIMRQLLEQGASALELGGKLREIAVLFVDVRGFTAMSESLDPPTVVEIVNRYLTLTTECIMKNHGTLDKFVGDCTMAFWNAPVEQKDAVYLACRAAVDMVEGSKALGDELMAKYGRTVSFGIGVNWGSAVIGNIGAPKRMDYTAIGDTVNTASRLESNAPGGKILISRAVADILGDRAEVTSLGDSIKLKGKAEGFEILTLDALKE